MSEGQEVEKLERLLGKLEYDKEMLKRRLDEETRSKQELVANHRITFLEINEKLKALTQDASHNKERFQLVKTERDRYKKTLAELPTIQEYKAQCKKLRECTSDNELLASRVKELEGNLASVEHQLSCKDTACQRLECDIGELRFKYEEVAGRLRVECEARPHSVSRLQSQVECLRDENDTLKRMLSKKHAEVDRGVAERETREGELVEKVARGDDRVAELTETVKSFREKLDIAENQVEQLQAHNAGLGREVARLEGLVVSSEESREEVGRLDELVTQCYSRLLNITNVLQAITDNTDPGLADLLGLQKVVGVTGSSNKLELYEEMLHKLEVLRVKVQRVYADRLAQPDRCHPQ